MVKEVIMSLDFSRASGPDGLAVVVLKNSEPDLSYIVAELFNIQGLIQPKDDSSYCFLVKNVWRPNSTFLSLSVVSKTVENENLKNKKGYKRHL